MSKVLKTAAVIVGVVALAATGIGLAADAGLIGLSAAGATLAAGIATVAGFAAAGLSLVGSLTAGPPPAATVGGNPTDFKADPYAGLPYAMGRTLVGGNIVYWRAEDAFSGGAVNDLETFVTVLSCAGPVQSIDALLLDKVETTFDGAGNAVGSLHDYFWHIAQLGVAGAAALAVTAGSSAMPSGWTAAHKLSGFAAAMTRARFDSKGKLFTSGSPVHGWIGHWVKVYDPRLDSTYPGGSGACRPLVESTYVWSANPYLHGLTWCLGRWQNGKRVIGLGASLADIDVPPFVEGANVCEANGWTLGGLVYSRPDTKWNVLKAMLQAGGGEPLTLGAKISCRVQTPRVSLATIGSGDIVGKATLAATKSRRDRKNIGFPRFRSEANDWQIVPTAAPISVAGYISDDRGEERRLELEYPLVQDATQASQLITYALADSREFGPVTLPLKPAWIAYKPGDCITLDVPECAAQPMLILQRSIAPATGIITLTLQSETGGKHAFALGKTGSPPPTASIAAHDPSVAAPAALSWSATGVAFTAASGAAIPALVVTGACENPVADAVIVEYRVAGTSAWSATSADPPTMTRKEITSVTPGTTYDVAVSYRMRGVIGQRRVYAGITAGSAAVVWSSLIGDGLPADYATRNIDAELTYPMVYPDLAALGRDFFVSAAGTYIVATTDTGGSAVQVAGNAFIQGRRGLPYSPEDLYEVRVDVETLSGGAAGTHYIGVAATDNTGSNLSTDYGSFAYVAAYVTDTVGRRTYVGYFRGVAAVGAGNDTGRPASDPASPAALPTGTVSVAPVMYLSYASTGGQHVVHSTGIRKVDDLTGIPTGPYSNTRNYRRGEEATSAEGRTFILTAPTSLGHIPPTTASGDAFWTLVADRGTDGTNGTNGLDAKTIYLTVNRQVVSYDASGAVSPSSQDIVFTAFRQNTTEAAVFSIYYGHSTALFLSGTGDTRTMTASNFDSIRAYNLANFGDDTVRVIATLPTPAISDYITINRVSAGAAAITGFLTNEAAVLGADASGTVSDYGPATGIARVYSGTTDVSAYFNISFTDNPYSVTIVGDNSTKGYSVTGGLGVDAASIVVRMTGTGAYAGVVVDKVFSLSKSKTGTSGANGYSAVVQGSVDGATAWHSPVATGDHYLRVSNDSGATFGSATLIRGADGTPGYSTIVQGSVDGATAWHSPVGSGDHYLRVSTDGGSTFGTATLIKGADGAPGASSVVQGSIDGATAWHAPATTGDKYIRVSNDSGATFGPATLIRGADGAPALTIPSPPGISVPCYANGTPKSSAPLATSQLSVFAGTADVTGSATYAIAAVSGCSATVSTAGLAALNSLTADTGAYFDVTITYSGLGATQRIICNKAKDGAAGNGAGFTVTFNTTTIYAVSGGSVDLALTATQSLNVAWSMDFSTGASAASALGFAEYSLDGGSTWTTFASGTSTSIPAFDTGTLSLTGTVAATGTAHVVKVRIQTKKSGGGITITYNQPAIVSGG